MSRYALFTLTAERLIEKQSPAMQEIIRGQALTFARQLYDAGQKRSIRANVADVREAIAYHVRYPLTAYDFMRRADEYASNARQYRERASNASTDVLASVWKEAYAIARDRERFYRAHANALYANE
jgi:hypothetical protein